MEAETPAHQRPEPHKRERAQRPKAETWRQRAKGQRSQVKGEDKDWGWEGKVKGSKGAKGAREAVGGNGEKRVQQV